MALRNSDSEYTWFHNGRVLITTVSVSIFRIGVMEDTGSVVSRMMIWIVNRSRRSLYVWSIMRSFVPRLPIPLGSKFLSFWTLRVPYKRTVDKTVFQVKKEVGYSITPTSNTSQFCPCSQFFECHNRGSGVWLFLGTATLICCSGSRYMTKVKQSTFVSSKRPVLRVGVPISKGMSYSRNVSGSLDLRNYSSQQLFTRYCRTGLHPQIVPIVRSPVESRTPSLKLGKSQTTLSTVSGQILRLSKMPFKTDYAVKKKPALNSRRWLQGILVGATTSSAINRKLVYLTIPYIGGKPTYYSYLT